MAQEVVEGGLDVFYWHLIVVKHLGCEVLGVTMSGWKDGRKYSWNKQTIQALFYSF